VESKCGVTESQAPSGNRVESWADLPDQVTMGKLFAFIIEDVYQNFFLRTNHEDLKVRAWSSSSVSLSAFPSSIATFGALALICLLVLGALFDLSLGLRGVAFLLVPMTFLENLVEVLRTRGRSTSFGFVTAMFGNIVCSFPSYLLLLLCKLPRISTRLKAVTPS
jgi:hypothetical protein